MLLCICLAGGLNQKEWSWSYHCSSWVSFYPSTPLGLLHLSPICVCISLHLHRRPALNLSLTMWSPVTPSVDWEADLLLLCTVLKYKLKICAHAQDPWGTLKGRFHSDECSLPMLTLQLLGQKIQVKPVKDCIL